MANKLNSTRSTFTPWLQNAAAGVSGLHPVTYKQALRKARQVLAAEGISDTNLFTGDAYSAARGTDGRGGRKDNDDKNHRHSHDRYQSTVNHSNTNLIALSPSGRERRGDERKKRGGSEHIGMFCGQWNNGGHCDSSRCSRKHRCSRISADGSFCGSDHKSFEHK